MADILTIGEDGLIGAALCKHLCKTGHNVSGTSRKEDAKLKLDLAEDEQNWPDLPKVDAAIFCAAITKLDMCENEPKRSHFINVEQTQKLMQKLLDEQARIIFLSTSQVFDGEKPLYTAEDKTCPVNQYGKQKVEVESWLLSTSPASAVLRVPKVLGGPPPIFSTWHETLTAGKEVQAFTDLAIAPVQVSDVCEAIEAIVSKHISGVQHLSATSHISYFALAKHYAKTHGFDSSLVKPQSAVDAGINPLFLQPYGGSLTPTGLPVKAYTPLETIFGEAAT